MFVVEGGRPIGVVSARDFYAVARALRIARPAREVMSGVLLGVDARETIANAARFLGQAHLHTLLVEDAGWVVGLFGQAELLASRDLDPATPVERVMGHRVISIPPGLPLYMAASQAGDPHGLRSRVSGRGVTSTPERTPIRCCGGESPPPRPAMSSRDHDRLLVSRSIGMDTSRKLVYWHRELPPLSEQIEGEHVVEAHSDAIPNRPGSKEQVWETCHRSLIESATRRLEQEIRRLGGSCAHVLAEDVREKLDPTNDTIQLVGRFTYVLLKSG